MLTTGRPEADELASVMVMAGVPESDIVIERESDNTQNAANVKQILSGEDGSEMFAHHFGISHAQGKCLL